MKRQKVWFIALSLALLTACVGVWRWSERPPYRFLGDRNASSVSIDDYLGEIVVRYEFKGGRAVLEKQIEQELGLRSLGDEHTWEPSEDETISIEPNLLNGIDTGMNEPSVAQFYVTVRRPATVPNRVRAWLYNLSHGRGAP